MTADKKAQELLAAVDQLVQQLRDAEWTKEDFARALRKLLEPHKEFQDAPESEPE